MKVEQVMTQTVFVVQPDHSLHDAARIMWEHDCGVVPVTDGGGCVIGMITDRDVAMAAYLQDAQLRRIPVERAMSKGVYSCSPADDVVDAEAAMRSARVRRLAVLGEGGQLVGLLSLSDVARQAAGLASARSRRARQAEVGETLSAISAPRALEAGNDD
jgi:CBS domain-containing protein